MTHEKNDADTRVGGPAWLAWLLIASGALGLFGAFELSVERVNLLLDPEGALACDINPFITCSGAMESAQGSAFGFPNPFIGLMGFVAPIAVGVALLAGAKFKRWFWVAFTVGLTGALAFVLWLAWNSIFLLGIVCPWCFGVWVAVYAMFFPTLTHSIAEGAVKLGSGAQRSARKFLPYSWIASFLLLVVVVLTIAIRLPELVRFLFM
ncbi:MAG TPA: vitamin K epoxide reductase family protein [Candidatus Agrococcus pullicola]|uniref:Vitamin K epoxide reductase family protein n=1 Tax=Candidatus Agrococcus pullicola TaxID=2838429 RepID=A0A9D1YT24_9MICO|nr:vitamin K epoxide reductase family protein [Candidatus Agrococcus pullicola]